MPNKRIIVYDETHEAKEVQLAERILYPQYTALQHTYGVILTYPEADSKLHYEIEISFVGKTENGDAVFNINRKQVYINNEAPDIQFYELADELAKAFYPLRLAVTKEGELAFVINYEEITERCTNAKNNIQEYYEGEIVNQCLKNFEKHYSNPNNILNALQADWFFQLYFMPKYGKYDTDWSLSKKHTLVYDKLKSPIHINMASVIEKEYTASGKIQCNVIGSGFANTMYADSIIDITYKHEKETKLLFACNAAIAIVANGITRTNLQVEIYDLNNKPILVNEAVHTKEAALTIGETQ
jgi:hypothetical protein